jgi:hypothetical protein
MENWLRGRPKFHGFDMNGFPLDSLKVVITSGGLLFPSVVVELHAQVLFECFFHPKLKVGG